MANRRNDVPNKIYLTEKELPQAWYNVRADLPNSVMPSLNPGTGEALVPSDLAAIFPMSLIEQELTGERYVEIPDEVRRQYATFRPAPLYRAYRLEEKLKTPARIYYKYEGGNTSGSHKLNSAIPQAYYNKAAGIRRLTTETGAGQWGVALSMACALYGLDLTTYMVKVSAQQKPYRKLLMETYGASVLSSPSTETEAGRKVLGEDPDNMGSLGTAISEAVEDAAKHADTNYALGSVLNHVLLHQSIIGLEALKQLTSVGEKADIVIGCCGGGSNFGGIAAPFVRDKLRGADTRLIAVEPSACPTLTRGTFAYDYGDTIGLTPMMPQYTLGHAFLPPGIHAGGLRYHGASQIVSQMLKDNLIEARAVGQTAVFDAAVLFARTEGLLPAPESSHAIRAAIDEALICKESGEEKVIVFCLSGNGSLDMTAYDNYLHGGMQDFEYTEEMVGSGLACLPGNAPQI